MAVIFNTIAYGIQPYKISDLSYMCLRKFNPDKMYLYNILTPTSMAYMFWENDTWNNIDLSEYINESKGNLPTSMIPINHICYLHDTLTTFKFPKDLTVNTAYSSFLGCAALTNIDWNGLKIKGSINSILNSCSSITNVDMSGVTILYSSATETTNMSSSFCNETSVVSIKLPSGLRPNTLYNLCTNNSALKSIDWNGLDASKCTDWRGAFLKCTSLLEMDLAPVPLNVAGNKYQSMFLGDVNLKKIWVPKESIITPSGGAYSPFYSIGGTNLDNGILEIYTDAISESDLISSGKWTTYWNYYSTTAKIPSSRIHYGATHLQFLDA